MKKKLIKNKCEIEGCEETEFLHLHHIIERTEAETTNHDLNLVILCDKHHKYVHLNKLKIIGIFPSTKAPNYRTVVYELDGKRNIEGIDFPYYTPKIKKIKIWILWNLAMSSISSNNANIVGTAGDALSNLKDGYTTVSVNSLTNITTKFREAFEAYTPNQKWLETKASGDLIMLDGNAAASSYLVISKDPFTAGSTSKLESLMNFSLPLESSIGISLSQRTLGQEFSVEFIDNNTTPVASEVAISSISQTTTTLTVNTATAHNLKVGYRIGIKNVSDSRLNYPALVVASTPSTTQFTATAGPGGTIPSLTIGPFTSGSVFFRSSILFAQNGTSMIFENATATNASFYVRSESGDVFPSGTIAGNHSVTINTTASVQAVNSAFNYTFLPTTEFKTAVQADKLQWHDSAVDAVTGTTARYTKTQVCPNHLNQYKLRFRAYNSDSLTVPVAQIVSATKSASTTATLVFDRPHGLTLTDQIIIYGIRDQTNFASQLTVVNPASIVNSTTITVVFGASATATSYGGFVARVNGGNLGSALGYIAQAVQSASASSNLLTLVGSASWSGFLIGDYINIYGVRNIVDGTSLGIDGVYRVANIATTTLTLEPITSSVSDFGLTNCGGGVIKRTDYRLSFVRVFDYDRERVEILPRPLSDISSSIPVNIQNTPNIGTVTTVSTVTAVTGAGLNGGVLTTDIASAAITTSTTTAAVTQGNAQSAEFNVIVTATSGTNQTLDVGVEESDDSGTNWYRIYDFPRITAIGAYRTPVLRLTGNRIRYVQTVAGTTPSFTRSLNRLNYSYNGDRFRQIFDRTIAVNTLNSTTTALLAESYNLINVVVSLAASGTAPVLQLEGSEDNSNWYSIGNTFTPVVNATNSYSFTNIYSKFLRVRVSTAGTGATLNYICIKSS